MKEITKIKLARAQNRVDKGEGATRACRLEKLSPVTWYRWKKNQKPVDAPIYTQATVNPVISTNFSRANSGLVIITEINNLAAVLTSLR